MSSSLAGLGVMAAAVALSWLPGFHGVGPVWSAVMLAGGAAAAVHELRAAGRPLPGLRLPGPLAHPLFPPAFAAAVGVHAFHQLRFGIVPLLWLAAAVLLCADQGSRAARAPDGFGRRFDLRRAWHGHRRWTVLGVGLCLASLFMTWGRTGGWLGGGYDYAYRYDSSADGYQYRYDYNPAKYYYPGFELSGRNQPLALFAEAALFALLFWAAYRRPGDDVRGGERLAVGLVAFLALWWAVNLDGAAGVWAFLPGLAAIGFGVWKVHRGEEEGEHDPAHLLSRLRAARG
ncbi:MAG TPA: hypothetical protein VF263_20015 [Longimicrobiaceae bacterium]